MLFAICSQCALVQIGSREVNKKMAEYGCIGKKLTHSFSKEIHEKLADYKYELIELNEDETEGFFAERNFKAVNITIPYKETVIPYMDILSDTAKRIGAVNCVVNKNNKLYGYNTDYYGMKALFQKADIDPKDKKVLILGSGGTSKTARILTEDMGALQIITVSRTKKDNCITYEEALADHKDAQIIINTTPSGMYPDCDNMPIDISGFNCLEGVIDAIYNPLCSNLVLKAQEKGIKAEGGLYMLVMQAVFAVQKFLDTEIDKSAAQSVFADILSSKENIVLTGMPGSGKTTVGKLISPYGFTFVDTDSEIEKLCGCSIKELIESKGEKYFRDTESEVIKSVSSKGSQIISTGGGAILRKENVTALRRNGRIFFLNANPERLYPSKNRPLSDTADKLKRLYEERLHIYNETADVIVPDSGAPQSEAEFILKARTELIK